MAGSGHDEVPLTFRPSASGTCVCRSVFVDGFQCTFDLLIRPLLVAVNRLGI